MEDYRRKPTRNESIIAFIKDNSAISFWCITIIFSIGQYKEKIDKLAALVEAQQSIIKALTDSDKDTISFKNSMLIRFSQNDEQMDKLGKKVIRVETELDKEKRRIDSLFGYTLSKRKGKE